MEIKIPWGTHARQCLLKDVATSEEIEARAKYYRKQEIAWNDLALKVALEQGGVNKYGIAINQARSWAENAKALEELIK